MGLIVPDHKSRFFSLRKKFILTAGSLVSAYFAAHIGLSHLADNATSHLSRMDINKSDIQELTTAHVNFHNPGTRSSFLYAVTTLSSDHIRESYRDLKRAQLNHDVTFVKPMALRLPGWTKGSFVDKLTLGLSSKIFPCAIQMPSENIDIDDLKKFLTFHNSERVINLPGSIEDYLKIITYHEIGHCDQPRSLSENHLENELSVDRNAIQKFLNDGGSLEVAKATIYARVLQGVLNSGYYSEDRPVFGPVMGPVFAFEFLDLNPTSYKQAVEGFKQIRDILPQKAEEADLYYVGGDRNATIKVIDYILKNSREDLSYEVQTILELYKQAYEFFMGPYDPEAPEYQPEGAIKKENYTPV